MKITVDIEGGGSLILEGVDADEFFSVSLMGYADEKDLRTPGCMISISPGQRVVETATEKRITV